MCNGVDRRIGIEWTLIDKNIRIFKLNQPPSIRTKLTVLSHSKRGTLTHSWLGKMSEVNWELDGNSLNLSQRKGKRAPLAESFTIIEILSVTQVVW